MGEGGLGPTVRIADLIISSQEVTEVQWTFPRRSSLSPSWSKINLLGPYVVSYKGLSITRHHTLLKKKKVEESLHVKMPQN